MQDPVRADTCDAQGQTAVAQEAQARAGDPRATDRRDKQRPESRAEGRAAPRAERWVARILPGEDAALVPAPRGPFGRAVVRALLRETVPDAQEGVAFRVPLDRVTILVGFCEDDGLLRALPINFLRWGPDGDPVAGPVVITREDSDGALYALRPGDLERLALVPGAPGGPRVLAVRVGGGTTTAVSASAAQQSGSLASAGPVPSPVA